jgi:FtsP/CotA-like multicopper oxidase with cupredoxin domain
MVRIGLMAKRILIQSRRRVLSGLGAAVLAPVLPGPLRGQGQDERLLLQATATTLALRAGEPETPVWALQAPAQGPALRFKPGIELAVTLQNDLPLPIALDWRGLESVAAMEPVVALAPVGAGAKTTFMARLRHAGTTLCDLRLLEDGARLPSRPLPVVVEESQNSSDRDEVFLVEDWRLRADGTAAAPGLPLGQTKSVYTVNGVVNPDIAVRSNERLRLRFINAFQRHIIALKIAGHDVRVIALDGEPAEPFLARNSALVLAPGGRTDTLIDVGDPPGATSDILLHDGNDVRILARLVVSDNPPARPSPLAGAAMLPSNGLPAQLDLRNALRVALELNGPAWIPAAGLAAPSPVFRASSGRVVVLALTNSAKVATVFHLHGHHFRLLDRLDDGWKPYWLDTLAVEPGQTERIAFAAEHAGRWLLESVANDWAAPRLLRCYSVEQEKRP